MWIRNVCSLVMRWRWTKLSPFTHGKIWWFVQSRSLILFQWWFIRQKTKIKIKIKINIVSTGCACCEVVIGARCARTAGRSRRRIAQRVRRSQDTRRSKDKVYVGTGEKTFLSDCFTRQYWKICSVSEFFYIHATLFRRRDLNDYISWCWSSLVDWCVCVIFSKYKSKKIFNFFSFIFYVNVHVLLLLLLLQAQPGTLLVLDSAQWLDSASWALLVRIRNRF